MVELMCLGKWGSQALSMDYRGGMIHFHFHWVKSICLSSLYHEVRFWIFTALERYVFRGSPKWSMHYPSWVIPITKKI